MNRREYLVLTLSVLTVGTIVAGQQTSLASSVDELDSLPREFAVAVTDSNGRQLPGLTRDDFEVLVDGKPQPLVVFDTTPRPLAIVVLLDTSGSGLAALDMMRAALRNLTTLLKPGDKIRAGAFNDSIQLAPSFTDSAQEFAQSVSQLDYGNGTRLWDAVIAGVDALSESPLRRALIVVTDGDDTASKAKRSEAVRRADAANVRTYTIGRSSAYFDGQRTVQEKPDGRDLRAIALETGGRYLEANRSATDLRPYMVAVFEELHALYTVGIAPGRPDGKEHKLAITVKKPGATARVRRTYVAASPNRRR